MGSGFLEEHISDVMTGISGNRILSKGNFRSASNINTCMQKTTGSVYSAGKHTENRSLATSVVTNMTAWLGYVVGLPRLSLLIGQGDSAVPQRSATFF